MPFPEGTPDVLRAAYGAIEKAVYHRADTAGVWSSIRNALGGTTSGIGFRGAQAVSSLRGIAAQVRNAEERLTAAASDTGIHHSMIGLPPWARADALRAAAPSYVIRFEALSDNPAALEGVPGAPEFTSSWLSLKLAAIPATVGELRDLVGGHVSDAALTRRTATGTPTGPIREIGRIQLLGV